MNIPELATESDVEQHVLFPILSREAPEGLGYPPESIKTKADIRSLTIGKGREQKLYFPDYALLVGGYPTLVVEAKAPGEDINDALREARLYASELNSYYPDFNPVSHIIACNGEQLVLTAWDSQAHLVSFNPLFAGPSSQDFASFLQFCCYSQSSSRIKKLIGDRRSARYTHPLDLIGGTAHGKEELPPNSFGTSIALDHRGLFNPVTRDERVVVAQHAYVPSSKRDRYVEPIDRIIRAARPPSETQATTIADQNNPVEIISALKRGRELDHQVILIVGGVGVGKSTFIDYLREVKLPRELRRATVWLNIDMNNAPVSAEQIYGWIETHLITGLKEASGQDHDQLETIRKVFSKEINAFRKGPASLFPETSDEYTRRLADHLDSLLSDRAAYAKALTRYVCGNASKSCIVVLDNCDKRVRDEQLLMFEVAQWLQSEFKMLVILPLRDETFDNHRNQPPLDTAIKDLVFRIEPAMFQEVLRKRINLALSTIDPERLFEYYLPNGMRVTYTGRDQAAYLQAILKSIHEHDRFVRRLITGLAGRNLRRALELFLDFCKSGHIPDDAIFKTKTLEDQFELPFDMVSRVLLRGSHRYYRGDDSHVKNLLSLHPSDTAPNYFVRFAILKWLEFHWSVRGPLGVEGYHQVVSLVSDLTLAGYEEGATWRELLFLLRSDCVVAEHLGTDHLDRTDLIKLSPAGWVHLDMLNTVDYYAAVAEDTMYDDKPTAAAVAERIVSEDHYSAATMTRNAESLVGYLQAWQEERPMATQAFLKDERVEFLRSPREVLEAAQQSIRLFRDEHAWDVYASQLTVGASVEGMITKVIPAGFIVWLNDALSGLIHFGQMPPGVWDDREEMDGVIVRVRVLWKDSERKRISLRFLSIVMK